MQKISWKSLVKVALPYPKSRVVFCDGSVEAGKRVIAEVGGKKFLGYSLGAGSGKAQGRIKEVIDEKPIFSAKFIKFAELVASYYLTAVGDILHLADPPHETFTRGIKLKRKETPSLPFAERGLLALWEYLKKKKSVSLRYVKTKFGATGRDISSLVERGFLEYDEHIKRREIKIEESAEETKEPTFALTQEQEEALKEINKSIEAGIFKTFLLFGVTGSGKTEVYIRACKTAISLGKTALVLFPEIAVTTHLLSRFKGRIGKVAVLHSGLPQSKRTRNWWMARRGEAKIVVGARSALFAPLDNIGVIIVDEEHDKSYKQDPDENPFIGYNAKDMAILRAKLEKCPVVLGSATPSFESFYNAETGRYKLIRMTNRIKGLSLPDVEVVDLKRERCLRGLSIPISVKMYSGLRETLEDGKQVILLMNRRGIAPFVFCKSCGATLKCEMCDANLVLHGDGLVCHWCSSHYSLRCIRCLSISLEYIGFGTQRVEDEIKKIFRVPIFRLDSDTAKNVSEIQDILENFSKNKPAILLGTQMVSKGLDFPDITFVGVILADVAFDLPDFRLSERIFQMLTQVVGRAGRVCPGKTVVQTYDPENPAIKHVLKGDYKGFYNEEIESRAETFWPPLSRTCLVKFSSLSDTSAKTTAQKFAGALKLRAKDITVLGPAPSPRYKVKGNISYNLIIKAKDYRTLREAILNMTKRSRFWSKDVKVTLDIDPLWIH